MWLAICAPELYKPIRVHSSRVKELIEDLSKPGSRIVQHAEDLAIYGPVPWLALVKLLKLLPSLRTMTISDDDFGASRPAYHTKASLFASVASRAMLSLTSLVLWNQRLSSAADVLCLLACFPHPHSLELNGCTIQTASSIALLVASTRLKTIQLKQYDDPEVCEGTLLSLAQWWRWPHEAAEPATIQYPGLHRADAQHVFAIIRSTKFGMLWWETYVYIYSQIGSCFTQVESGRICQCRSHGTLVHVSYVQLNPGQHTHITSRGPLDENTVFRWRTKGGT